MNLAFSALLVALNPLALAQSSVRPRPPTQSVRTMLDYPLTPSGLERYEKASRAMTALISKDPGVLTKLKPPQGGGPNSIDDTVAFTKAHCPECLSTVEKSGMPYRDYVVFQGSLLIAYISTVRPRAGSQVHVSPPNIRFVQENRQKIERILAEQRRQPGSAK